MDIPGKISKPSDLRNLTAEQLEQLAEAVRARENSRLAAGKIRSFAIKADQTPTFGAVNLLRESLQLDSASIAAAIAEITKR